MDPKGVTYIPCKWPEACTICALFDTYNKLELAAAELDRTKEESTNENTIHDENS